MLEIENFMSLARFVIQNSHNFVIFQAKSFDNNFLFLGKISTNFSQPTKLYFVNRYSYIGSNRKKYLSIKNVMVMLEIEIINVMINYFDRFRYTIKTNFIIHNTVFAPKLYSMDRLICCLLNYRH